MIDPATVQMFVAAGQLAADFVLVVGTVMVPILINKALHNQRVQEWLHITNAEADTLSHEASIVAGVLLSRLSRGTLVLGNIHVDDPHVREMAEDAIQAGGLDQSVTVDKMTAMVVNEVMRAVAADPTIQTIPGASPNAQTSLPPPTGPAA